MRLKKVKWELQDVKGIGCGAWKCYVSKFDKISQYSLVTIVNMTICCNGRKMFDKNYAINVAAVHSDKYPNQFWEIHRDIRENCKSIYVVNAMDYILSCWASGAGEYDGSELIIPESMEEFELNYGIVSHDDYWEL